MTSEDVISWLEYLSDDARSKADGLIPTNIEIACGMAIDALKAHEPRLLRVDVSDASWHDGVLWFEHRDDKTIKPCLFVNCREMILFGRMERVMCFDVVGRSSSIYMLKNYGVKYRCWTSRPDEKRREETPWN